jgi:hypothetical protein
LKIALNSVGYKRPELHQQSLDTIFQCDDIDQVDIFCYIDGTSLPDFVDDYDCTVIFRNSHIGLSKNILLALKDQFTAGYDIVIHIEDDMLLSRDFVKFIVYCFEHFKEDDVFSVAGYSTPRIFSKLENETCVEKTERHSTLGVAYDRSAWNMIAPHVKEEYFGKMLSYIKNFEKKCMNDSGAIHYEQAGLINTIRKNVEMLQIVPHHSRCQNIGIDGAHGRFDASTPTYKDNYEWETLWLKR